MQSVRAKHLLLAVLCCCLIEIFIFNINYFTSSRLNSVNSSNVVIGKGLKAKSKYTYSISDPENAYIKISNIDSVVGNVHIPLKSVERFKSFRTESIPIPHAESANREDVALHLSIKVDDAAHTFDMSLPEILVHPKVLSSHWDILHLSGITHNVTLKINEPVGTEFSFSSLPNVNVRIPFHLSFLRLFAYLFISFLLVYRKEVTAIIFKEYCKKASIILWFASSFIAVLIIVGTVLIAKPWLYLRMSGWQADFEYQSMARSLARGHSWIDFPVSDALNNLSNPYDNRARALAHKGSGESFLFDYAFYNGRYYSYFGILPCIMFFLPYFLITGNDLSPWKVVLLLAIFMVLLAIRVVYLIFERWSENTPVVIQIICSYGLVLAIQPAFYLTFFATTYSVPIIMGLVLALITLCLWLKSSMALTIGKRWLYAIFGCLSLGLILGCRPQFCIIILFVPFIIHSLFLNIRNKFISSCLNLVAAAGLSLITMAPFFVWNYIRFGKITDFGATYQLTATDMNLQSDGLSKIPYALRQGFFSPPSSTDRFPFLKAVATSSEHAGDYQGFYNLEPTLGGFFFWCPIGLFAIALISSEIRERYKNIPFNLLGFTVVSFLASFAPLYIDVTAAAFTQRYLCDFGYLIGISGILAFIILRKIIHNKYIDYICVIFVVWSLIFSIWSLFMSGRYNSLIDSNPEFYIYVMKSFSIFN
ncbi:hypothetical protein [Bifidobacterium aerophilum]|uniref:Uncharacterized protein n=1 Tax=Bifidobacterium aerophilum TaxID=1798155 RepID=A0A6N9Z6R8_9BIFI|nr:hypothetical protein [Bifidobacterium aerophilum]NEG90191.1 hypothetical protein [Bifidobacterium aerophilum]